MNSLTWTFNDAPTGDEIAELRSRLAAWNIAVSGIANERWLAWFVHDEGSDLVGGAVGRAWGAVLELRFLWVHERLRGRGVGSELLTRIEQDGASLGCTTVTTDTFSFQAPEFYRKHGYEVFGYIDGYPESTAKYYLRKTIQ